MQISSVTETKTSKSLLQHRPLQALANEEEDLK